MQKNYGLAAGDKDMDFVSGFGKQSRKGAFAINSENADNDSSMTNSVGEEDYVGDTDGSMGGDTNRIGVINGNSYSNQKKPAASKKKNIPN